MRTHTQSCLSFVRRMLGAVLFTCLLITSLFATEAQAAVIVTRTSSPVFYTHSSVTPNPPICNYLAFNVTSSTAISDAWVTISGFGTNLSLGGGDNGIFHAGPLVAGQTTTAFYYVCSSYTGGATAADGYSINTYSGNPSFGGTLQATTPFSTTINDNVIQAAANQVNAIWADINPSVLGATTTLTVDGDTGTIGCTAPSSCSGAAAGPLSFNPATFPNWRADAYELVGSSIVLSQGNSGTYNNTLYIDNLPSSSTTHYDVVYYFRPVATTASTTTLSPVNYIASGNQIKHTNLGSGAYAAAGGLLPILPAQNTVLLAKTVSTSTLPAQGGVVTYTLSATNNGSYDLSLDSFIDVLPAGATYVTGSTTFNNASFADPYISGSNLSWSSIFTIPAGTTRTLIFQATLPATPGTYTNSATARIGNAVIDTTLATSDNVPPTATTVVLKAPTIAKSFAPTSLAVNSSSVLTLTISNTNASQTLNGIAVSDTMPAGLVFAAPPNGATTCPGATLSVSGTTVAIAGGTLTAGQSCTVSVNVSSASNAAYTNTTGTVSSSNGGNGSTATATVTFSPKPTITKSFSVATIPRNGTATLTFTITNNTATAISGVTFDDLFPAGMVTANPPAVSPASPCGGTLSSWNGVTAGTVSASGGDFGVRLTGGSIATAGGTCTFSIDVTAVTAGVYANTASGVNSNESSPVGPVSNTATLSVLDGPTVAKAFSPSDIGKNQTSTLTVTLTNPNATAITGAAFADTYPANVTTAFPANASTTCPSGTVNSTSGSVSLSGATIPASGSCTVSIDVTSSVVNLTGYVNTIAAGSVTTTNAGSNTASASATLIVSTPTIVKSFAFNPATGISTMSITVSNNDVVAITNLSFHDLFPTNMVTANPPAVAPATPCGAGSSIQSWNGVSAGTLTATGGDLGIQLTAGQIAAGGSCSFTINLVVNALGVYTNQIPSSTGSFAGIGSASNIATWIAPAVSKVFSPKTVGPNDTSRMSITITNPSLTSSLTGLAISDTYPTTATKVAGGALAAAITSPSPAATNTCGGTITATSTGISLSGGTLAPGASCTIAANVLATNTTPAVYANTTGKAASNQGIGVTGSDSLLVTVYPTIKKSFLTSPVTLSGGTATSVMHIVIENNSGGNITGVSFSDIFPSSPAQMRYVNTLGTTTCTGALTDASGGALVGGTSTGIKMTGGSITAAAVTCTIDITVSVPAPGSYSNTTSGAISSANTVVGPASNTAVLVAYLPAPTVTKAFATSGFQVNGTDRITITLTNPNTAAITGVAFTDTYPGNMLNASTPNLASTCGGTATAAASTNTVSLSGGTIPASGSCNLQVDVTATAVGAYTNTLAINSVTSTNANAGPAAAASASATAYLPPTLTKTFGAAGLTSGGTTTLSLTLANPAGNPAALTTVQVDDTFPAGLTLQNTTFTYSPAACGTVTKTTGAASAAGDNNVRLSVASLAAGASCQVSVNVTSSTLGIITNTTNAPTAAAPAALAGIAASANLTVSNAPSITMLKTVRAYWDPYNGTANPLVYAPNAKNIPGAIVEYAIIASNSGGPADNNSTVITDPITANTALYVNDIGGAGSGPVLFTQGATSSTLTYNFTALNNMADDISFSNDGGATWGAVPAAGANGCDTNNINSIRINPKGTFIGGTPNPSFQLTFRVCVK